MALNYVFYSVCFSNKMAVNSSYFVSIIFKNTSRGFTQLTKCLKAENAYY